MGKLHEGVWLPNEEVHLVEMMTPGAKRFARLVDGRAAYQRHKYLRAMDHVQHRKVFVDIGGHVGLWSMQAEDDFESIIAFEPHPIHAELYRLNVSHATLHECALGDDDRSISLSTGNGSSGDTWVSGPGSIPMKKLDDFQIERIDLLKIDTEGYELPIVRGARDTLLRCKPVVVVEQKGRDERYHGEKKNGAVEYLKSLGAIEIADSISGDYFMGWQ